MLEELPFNLFITSWIIVHSIMLNYIIPKGSSVSQTSDINNCTPDTSASGERAQMPLAQLICNTFKYKFSLFSIQHSLIGSKKLFYPIKKYNIVQKEQLKR